MRWEQLREGIEDYEYFWLLKNKSAELKQSGVAASLVSQAEILLAIPDDVAASPTQFTDDPAALGDYREKVGTLIEQMEEFSVGADAGSDATDGADSGIEAADGADAQDSAKSDAAEAGSVDSSIDSAIADAQGASDSSVPASQPAPDDSGCSCRTAPNAKPSYGALMVAAIGVALLRGRRKGSVAKL
jgi:MYXO-CTERM domain-containing protein